MRYLRALRVSLKSFSRDRKNVHIENITVADVEAWLDKNGESSDTKLQIQFRHWFSDSCRGTVLRVLCVVWLLFQSRLQPRHMPGW